MKSDKELVEEFLRDHPVQRVKVRRRKSTLQFRSVAVKGIRRGYRELLRDHRDSYDPQPEAQPRKEELDGVLQRQES